MVQQPTSDQPHPFGQTPPVGWNGVPSLLSLLFDSTGRSGDQAMPGMLGSLFQLAPAILSSALAPLNQSGSAKEERTDKGKGKARAVDSDDVVPPGPTEDDAFVASLQEAMKASRRTGSRVSSPYEAGPSGSSAADIVPPTSGSALLSQTHPPAYDSEQAEIDRAILKSSIEHIENTFHALRTNFVFPTQLDCHPPSDADSHVLTSSSSDEDTSKNVAAYLPATSANSTVLNFVRDLSGLLRQLDRVNSDNDMEAKLMKERVAGAISKALEDVEGQVEEVIGKWMSLQTTEVDL